MPFPIRPGLRPALRHCCGLMLTVSAVLGAADARAQSGIWPGVHIRDRRTAGAVRLALDGAARRLTHQRCQTLFTEFHDEHDNPLSERLAELGPTAREYLEQVVWHDGSRAERCRQERTLAFTAAGYRVVFICGPSFQQAHATDRNLAEAILIHEMLHSLGLGENPPSSQAITYRVQSQCRG